MPKAKDLTGRTFGRWKVISQAERIGTSPIEWHVECFCGKKNVILGKDLLEKKTESCGCLEKDMAKFHSPDNKYRKQKIEEQKGFNHDATIYRDVPILWDNIQKFHIMFLEAQCKMTAVDLQEMELEENKLFWTAEYKIKRIKEIQRQKEIVLKELKDTYTITWLTRKKIENMYETSPPYKDAIDKKCQEEGGVIFWINNFCWTYDPRLPAWGIPAKVPLILFPAQEEIIYKLEECYEKGNNVLIEKARAEGLTEILCAYSAYKWKYNKDFKIGWGSRTKYMVDQSGNPDTIFERLRRIIYNLPKGMKPPHYNTKPHQNKFDISMRLVNPENGSTIVGEGGKSIGRGGRSSMYFVDEKADLEDPVGADQSLSFNTNCQVDVSTPKGANHFYQKRKSGLVIVLTVKWHRNPTKNLDWGDCRTPPYSSWFFKQEITRDPVLLAQEVLIDYHASVAGSMIPSEWVKAAIAINLKPNGEKAAGFDIAAGGKDKTTYVSREGVCVESIMQIPSKTPLEGTWKAAEIGEREGICVLNYDQNAYGEDVYPLLTTGDRTISFTVVGIYGQGKASEGYLTEFGKRGYEVFRNKRAELWWGLRKRFERTYLHYTGQQMFPTSDLISIPDHTDLEAELSAPLLVYSASGKIGVESKREMKTRKIPSPDYGDGTAYCFNDIDSSQPVVNGLTYKEGEVIKSLRYKVSDPHYIMVSLYMTDAQEIYGLVTKMNYAIGKLQILAERRFDTVNAKENKEWVYDVLNGHSYHLKNWIGNKKMFEGLAEGKLTTWYEYRKQDIPITENYMNDYDNSLIMMNGLFSSGLVEIDSGCESLISQVRLWRVVRGKPENGMFFCECLSQLILTLKKMSLIKKSTVSSMPQIRGYGR